MTTQPPGLFVITSAVVEVAPHRDCIGGGEGCECATVEETFTVSGYVVPESGRIDDVSVVSVETSSGFQVHVCDFTKNQLHAIREQIADACPVAV